MAADIGTLPTGHPTGAVAPAPQPRVPASEAASAAGAVLYSFRRCPYAIRARLALAAAGWQPGRDLEVREVRLQARPQELWQLWPRGTVPVLQSEGRTRTESLEIMQWALAERDPEGWMRGWSEAERQRMQALIASNDGPFKHHLDRCKYADRYPEITAADQRPHRREALAILREWSRHLETSPWLLGERPSLADMALLPFVRQFHGADPAGLAGEAQLAPLLRWLERFLGSDRLRRVMAPPWGPRFPWCSPRWLYHLALRDDWREARLEGRYRQSTRGMALDQVGFVHASQAHQIAATFRRFYSDLPAGAVLLLAIDPQRLHQAGVEVRLEPAPESGELFPHLYGGLPLAAVVWQQPWGLEDGLT